MDITLISSILVRYFLLLGGTLKKVMLTFNPTPKFLSDIIGFEGIIIALVIPLSFEIITRIADTYKSEHITNVFTRELPVRLLPKLLIINIAAALILRFCVNNEPASLLWKTFAWIIFIGFIIVGSILLRFIRLLELYFVNRDYILNKLYEKAEELFK